ncbi:hypothetical protein SODALDRAFT_374284 [Sodiomyces alkalinus F11]|uniref:Secreted protein n=1 Tax=Sodiomyces alkalinus (strain CBS 110278 / VKM F-3762 / F11) TaxID=1314773 RepID=A0A3N2Q5A1_SODAK|nr:hypothetical protein SODALDRAFT_374284 [Sodiomyces alkalinus F11]ROT41876.1 hypothetical protein SODALDRAFT_374284 [Sodiomyces alkalinus F11]
MQRRAVTAIASLWLACHQTILPLCFSGHMRIADSSPLLALTPYNQPHREERRCGLHLACRRQFSTPHLGVALVRGIYICKPGAPGQTRPVECPCPGRRVPVPVPVIHGRFRS